MKPASSGPPPGPAASPAEAATEVWNQRELRELEEQTAVGAIFLGALMRRQLRLSLGVAATFATLFGGQPLLAWLWPAYPSLEVFGIPLPWLVLGAVSYPALVLLGLYYVRRAEAIDDEFTDLLR